MEVYLNLLFYPVIIFFFYGHIQSIPDFVKLSSFMILDSLIFFSVLDEPLPPFIGF